MPPAPPRAGRPLTVAGLRVVLVTFIVFVALMLGLAWWFAPNLEPLEADMHDVLISVLAAVAVADIAMVWVVRRRSRAAWTDQLAAQPYAPGGAVPPAFGAAVIVGAALCEGLGLFGAVLYLLTRNPVTLAFGALAIVFIFLQMPKDSHLALDSSERQP